MALHLVAQGLDGVHPRRPECGVEAAQQAEETVREVAELRRRLEVTEFSGEAKDEADRLRSMLKGYEESAELVLDLIRRDVRELRKAQAQSP